ncbi:hypothetical protein [Mesoterricola sediminis]|uniref:Uncharacterized protein n=1 Tax=Mesoterricola sediminis TaxID=2927980 RepID=A0AA48H4G6_9BACT|nr:hypothetical protein [Mesoterricola sediminis]BDU75808.1 hypothetical protein METESE_07660 [Mesoterricola sediminis]
MRPGAPPPRVDLPQRLIDALFRRVARDLTLAMALLELAIVLGRLPGFQAGTTPPVLLVGPFLAFLVCLSGASLLAFGRPDRRMADAVICAGNASLSLVFGTMSLWYADPIRLFVFAILLLMAGVFQRSRTLYAVNLAVTVAALAFGLRGAPMPRSSAGIAYAVFFAAAAAGLIAHLLLTALVKRLHRALVRARSARQEVAVLQGLIPICAHCKKIRNDGGFWEQVESYIASRTAASFSHGVCPECLERHYPKPRR